MTRTNAKKVYRCVLYSLLYSFCPTKQPTFDDGEAAGGLHGVHGHFDALEGGVGTEALGNVHGALRRNPVVGEVELLQALVVLEDLEEGLGAVLRQPVPADAEALEARVGAEALCNN